jgi:hypothetical protein
MISLAWTVVGFVVYMTMANLGLAIVFVAAQRSATSLTSAFAYFATGYGCPGPDRECRYAHLRKLIRANDRVVAVSHNRAQKEIVHGDAARPDSGLARACRA